MRLNIVRFTILAMVLAVWINIQTQAATITADSCKQEDVQKAIDQAHDGDTVLVPAGNATWSSADQWTGAVKITKKSITLMGAGIGKTIIKGERTTVGPGWECAISVNGSEGKPFRVTGFTFNKAVDLGIKIRGTCKNWRVDHCEFICQPQTDSQGKEVAGINAIAVDDYTYGVVDHCTIQDGEININSNENDAWDRPLTLGSANAVYVEQCIMRETTPLDDVIDGRSGARYVLRYNNITNMELHCHGIEGGGTRGTHSYELYANMLNDDGKFNCYRHGYIRGGTGVIYDNVSRGKWAGDEIQLVHQCAKSGYCDPSKSTPTYPGKDQIGRSTDSNHDVVQDLEPLYAWNNKRSDADQQNGNPKILLVVQDFSPEQADYIKEGRDFYNDTPRPGYIPYPYPHPLTVLDESGRLLGLKGVENQGAVSLTWNAVKNTVKYQVRRNWGAEIVSLAATNTEYIDNAGGGYLYLVEAVDSDGTVLAAEGVMTDQEKPTVPTGLSAIPISGTQIDLKWGLSTDNLVLGGYRIYRNGELVNHNATLAYSDTNLTPNTLYTYTVTAYDAAGNESAPSESVAVTTPGSGGGGSDAGGGGGGGGGCFIAAVRSAVSWFTVLATVTAGLGWRIRREKSKEQRAKSWE